MAQVSNLTPVTPPKRGDKALNDMLQELRVLLQGAQVLVGFLIILPFNQGFAKIDDNEKLVYMLTFVCAVFSLIAFSTPAAYHRLRRPLPDKRKFKDFATRMIIAGLALLSISLSFATHLVVREAVGPTAATVIASLVALTLLIMWWLLPLWHKRRGR